MLSVPLERAAPKVSEALRTCLSRPPLEQLEVEFRLGKKTKDTSAFDPHISAAFWSGIKRALESNPRWQGVMQTSTVDHILSSNTRLTRCQTTGDATAVRKTRVMSLDIEVPDCPLDVRLSISTEVPMGQWPAGVQLPPSLAATASTKSLVRAKRRDSYLHNGWRFDLTRVERAASDNADSDEAEVYEVELEMDPMLLLKKPVDQLARHGLLLAQDLLQMVDGRHVAAPV